MEPKSKIKSRRVPWFGNGFLEYFWWCFAEAGSRHVPTYSKPNLVEGLGTFILRRWMSKPQLQCWIPWIPASLRYMCLWSGPQSDLVGVGEPTRGCQVLLGLVRTSWCQTKHYRFHSLDRSLQDRASVGHLGQGQNENSRNIRNRAKRCFRWDLCGGSAATTLPAPEECGCHSGHSAPQASKTPRSCHGGIGRLWGSRS